MLNDKFLIVHGFFLYVYIGCDYSTCSTILVFSCTVSTSLPILAPSRYDRSEWELSVPLSLKVNVQVCLSLTCEADGTLEGTSHAFKAVLYQVAKQLGR